MRKWIGILTIWAKRENKVLYSMIFIMILAAGNIFAQTNRISANGVTVPEWMQNCNILQSEQAFGSKRTIGQVLSIPNKNTKLKSVTIKNQNLSLRYQVVDDDDFVVASLCVEFVCVKYGAGGNCYISSISMENNLTFAKLAYSCYNPNSDAYNYGRCLAVIKQMVQGFFIDEVRLNEKKEEEARIKKAEDDLVEDFINRTSTTYIDDEHLDLGTITYFNYSTYANDYKLRLFACANRASVKKGFAPCYYQIIDGSAVYDSTKWLIPENTRFPEELIQEDENSTGFFIYGRYNSDLKITRKDKVRKANQKQLRNKEDEEIVARIASLKPDWYEAPDEICYYESFDYRFSGRGYSGREDEQYEDETRVYSILNKASKMAGYQPCYYQEQNGEKIYDSDDWNLGKMNDVSKNWEKSETIKRDENANGFYYASYKLYRNDPETFNERQQELRKLRDKEDEEFISEVLALTPESMSYDGDIEYSRASFESGFEGSKYNNVSSKVKVEDEIRCYAILNKASERMGCSPCYYQDQNGKRVYNSDKWELGNSKYGGGFRDREWPCYWENRDTIKQDESANGFYYRNSICYNNLEILETIKAYIEKILSSNVEIKNQEVIITVSKQKHANASFTLEDSNGRKIKIDERGLLKKINEISNQDWKMDYNYYEDYYRLHRDATEEEKSAYDKSRTEAVRIYFDGISKNGAVDDSSSTLRFKVPLDDSYSYSEFSLKDSTGKNWTIGSSDFVKMLNEITNQNWRIDGRALYRDATEDEKNAYEKPRTEAVRSYFDGISKNGAIDDSSSLLRFKVPLDSSYSNSSFTLKDLSDKTWTIRKFDFIEKLNEITNQNWRIDGRALYRDATEEEKSAYDKSRTEAVRIYFEGISKNGAVDDSSSTLRFKVPLDDSYSYSEFSLKDSTEKNWTIGSSDFVKMLNEITNQNWRIDGRALYRDAMEEEKLEFEEKLKVQKNREDEKLIEKILALKPSSYGMRGYVEYEYGYVSVCFEGRSYGYSGQVYDLIRMYALLNKASEKLGYKPCYYQVQDGKRIYNSEKWNLELFEINWQSLCKWENADTIKEDRTTGGLYGDYYSNSNYIRIFRRKSR